MQCPKCQTKLMVDGRSSKNDFNTRCMKCGAEFLIKNGVIKQKKSPKVIKLPKGVTITRVDNASTAKGINANLNLEQKRIIEQARQVRRLNAIAKNMRNK